MNKKYIITGAPGTGKTSIINHLNQKGYHCVDENSRTLITNQLAINGDILPWKNQIAFENIISMKRAKDYINSPKDAVCFFDRSIIDCIAYLKINKKEPTKLIRDLMKNYQFNKDIFYTPFWSEIYTNDKERKESIENAIYIEKIILETYKYYGYNPILVPKLSIKKRIDFILSKI